MYTFVLKIICKYNIILTIKINGFTYFFIDDGFWLTIEHDILVTHI